MLCGEMQKDGREEPCDDSVSDGCAVNIAPLQLGEKVRWIHSARIDEALVTAALYLDRCELKSACNVQTIDERAGGPLRLFPC